MNIEHTNPPSNEKPSLFETRYGSVRNEELHTLKRREEIKNQCSLIKQINKSSSSKFF